MPISQSFPHRGVPLKSRRQFLSELTAQTAVMVMALQAGAFSATGAESVAGPKSFLDPAQAADWLKRWEKNIIGDARNRYCDKELGEDLGWRVSPFLEGFYYGYLATGDTKWVEMLIDWTDAWVSRAVKEPDGYLGWPTREAAGTDVDDLNRFNADSFLGEAMCLRPVVLMADRMRKDLALREKHAAKAAHYLQLAEQTFEKWNERASWKETKEGGIWVVHTFGIDAATGKWTDDYAHRRDPLKGFSHPNNKANADARWHLAMFDVTGKRVYRDRAELWFREMKSRLKSRENGKYLVWNYWEPAGPWDYKPNGAPKHWVGVHPNGGYYMVDVQGIVDAFAHGLVFTREDIDRFIATNRDYMWNQKIEGAEFRRIDGGTPDEHWKKSPGLLWTALLPYDATLRRIFAANHDPAGWGGLHTTPWSLTVTAA